MLNIPWLPTSYNDSSQTKVRDIQGKCRVSLSIRTRNNLITCTRTIANFPEILSDAHKRS